MWVRQKTFLFLLIFYVTTILSQNTKVKLNSVDITLPGKWKVVGKNESSGQHTFENIDSKIGVAISVRQKTKFEFFKDSLTDFQLVEEFYKWDAFYWKDSKHDAIEIKKDEKKKYIIWLLNAPEGSNYILNGIKDSHLIGIHIQGDKTNETERIRLIESIYLK